jgi:hypothetical protein
VKSYTKIMSHFIDGLYMLCYGVLLKGDRLSQITEQQHLVSWACTRKRLYFVTSAFDECQIPLSLHNSHSNVHAFRLPPNDSNSYYDNDPQYLFYVHRLPFLMLPQCLH